MGLIDGVAGAVRAAGSSGRPGAGGSLLVVIDAVATWLGPAVLLGALAEPVTRAAARLPVFSAFGAWAAEGPRRWFARAPDAAAALAAALVGLLAALGPVFPAALLVQTTFHSKPLAATAILLVALASFALAPVLAALLAAPLRWLARRAPGPLASPGAVLALALLAVLAETARFVGLHREDLPQLARGAAYMPLCFALGAFGTAAALGVRARTRGRPLARRTVAAAVLAALAAFAVSAVALRAPSAVATALLERTAVTGPLLRTLQLVRDRDHDGHSPLFGGGDCDDRNPAVHAGAVDLPGNGVDEDCTGHDAVPELAEGSAAMVPLPLAMRALRPSVLLLSVDGDALDAARLLDERAATARRPSLAGLARGAVRFTHAYTPSPDPLAALAAVFTARYPSQLAWNGEAPALASDNVTLAEQLRAGGFATAAFTNTNLLGRSEGLDQGFDERHEGRTERDAPLEVLRYLDAFLRARVLDSRPFFAWVHLAPPGPDAAARDALLAALETALAAARDVLAVLETMHPVAIALYAPRGPGPDARAPVAAPAASDDLRPRALRVPLFVHAAGLPAHTVDAPVSLLDLGPTMLNLAQRPAAAPVAGRSLVPELLGVAPPTRGREPRDLFAEGRAYGRHPDGALALVREPYALVGDRAQGRFALYDLARDPLAREDLSNSLPARAGPMRERAMAWAEGALASVPPLAAVLEAARVRGFVAPRTPVRASFPEVLELLGADLPTGAVAAGGVLRATLYYRVLRPTPAPVWIELLATPDTAPAPLLDGRHYPLHGRYPSTQWVAGEVLRDEVAIAVPPATPPGRFRVRFAVATEPELTRVLPAPSERAAPDGAIALAGVEIAPPRR